MTAFSYLRFLVSFPFRIIRRINNWALKGPKRLDDLQTRFPLVIFQNQTNALNGQRVFIGVDRLFVAKANITIGNDTMIVPRVTIMTRVLC